MIKLLNVIIRPVRASKPGFRLFHKRRARGQCYPEARRMIALHEMGQFVANYIVEDKIARFDKKPR